MHQYFNETINVCNTAKQMADQAIKPKQSFPPTSTKAGLVVKEEEEGNHTCHRHWAFALYKKGDMANACKLIKKAV